MLNSGRLLTFCVVLSQLSNYVSAQPTQINGDFSRNGSVGPEDLLQLFEGFGQEVATTSGGALQWVKQAGSMSFDGADDIALYPGGDILIVGTVSPGAIFAPGEPEETTLTGSGNFSAVLARYDPDGTLQWVRNTRNTSSGQAQEGANAVSIVGSDETARVVGGFTNNAIFGSGEASEATLMAAGSQDIFVADYNSDGSFIWSRRAGSSEYEEGFGISSDADGNLVAMGVFDGTPTFGENGSATSIGEIQNGRTLFMASYDSTGALRWAQSLARATFGTQMDVAHLSDGSPIVAGVFRGQATLGMGQPNETVIDSGDSSGDGFIARFDKDGNFQWVVTIDSPDDDSVSSIAITQDQNILATGSFSETAVFGSAKGPAPSLVSVDSTDAFIASYSSDGDFQWARRAGSLGLDSGNAISAFADGTFVVGGSFNDDIVLGPGELFETTFIAQGDSANGFAAKFDSVGALQWARHLGGSGEVGGARVLGIAAADDGSCFAAGSFSRTTTFGIGGDDAVTLTELRDFGSVTDIFVARFGP